MSNRYINLASHAIGLDYSNPYIRHRKKFYKPYRNYFETAEQCEDFQFWDVLEGAQYAERMDTGNGNIIFRLTREGFDWLGECLQMTIYDEEE